MLKHFLTVGNRFSADHPDYRRALLLHTMMLAAIVVFGLFALLNIFVFHFYLIAAVDLCALIASIVLLVYLHKSAQVERVSNWALWIIALGLFAYLMIEKNAHYGLIWATTFFPFAFFLKGLRRGLMLSLLFYGVFIMGVLAHRSSWQALGFDAVSLSNVGVVLLALMALIGYYEKSRAEASAKLAELNRSLQHRIQAAIEENLAQQKLLIQRSKLADLGQSFAMLAHQWKQPLTVAALCVETLQEDEPLGKPEQKRYLENIGHQIAFLNQSVNDFQDFLRPDKTQSVFSPVASFMQTARLIEPIFLKKAIGLRFETNGCEAGLVLGYENEFKQVALNLLNNAFDAMRAVKKGSNSDYIIVRFICEEDYLSLCVEDSGAGIDEAIQSTLFELFATSKGNNGSGLGLYMSRIIIEKMNGTLTLKNRDNGQSGAVATIQLPLFKGGKKG